MSKKPLDPRFDPEITRSFKRTLCAAVLIRAEKAPAKGGSVVASVVGVAVVMLVVLTGRTELLDVLGSGP
ncbi:hypothetical protein [Rhodococcus sp. NPDC047139]|uniref:hypothetical protein n=1 Tax=Rhodococcus sp. NPDC047139 TaxID=3155141 RepID=UPI0033EFB729